MKLLLTGLNHRTMSIDIREQFAFPPDEAERFLLHLKQTELFPECLLISTCNRLEILVRYESQSLTDIDVHDELIFHVCGWKNTNPDDVRDAFYHLSGADAVNHLFRVVSGLDSQLVGEAQILYQVKEAYRLAGRIGSNGFLLNKLMHAAFRTGKRVRSETRLGTGAVSVGLAAADWLSARLKDIADPQVLIIGAGEMARLTATHLLNKGVRGITIANRTDSRAQDLASELSVRFIPWDEWAVLLHRFDGLVAAAAAPHILISKDFIRSVFVQRNKDAAVVDLGVPRTVEPGTGGLRGVALADVDDLKILTDENRKKRLAEIPLVNAIIREEQDNFIFWYRSLEVVPTIKRLVEMGERFRRDLLEEQRNKWTPDQLRAAELITQSLVRKILEAPVEQLRESVNHGTDNSAYWTALVERVFNLRPEA